MGNLSHTRGRHIIIYGTVYLHLGIDNTSAVTEHVSPRFDSAPRMRPLGKAKNCKNKIHDKKLKISHWSLLLTHSNNMIDTAFRGQGWNCKKCSFKNITIHWTRYLFSNWPNSNFWKLAPVMALVPDYAKIMSRILKVTRNVWPRCMISGGNHVKFLHLVLLAIIEGKKNFHFFGFCSMYIV